MKTLISAAAFGLLATAFSAHAATRHENWSTTKQADGKCIALANPSSTDGSIEGREMPYVAVMNSPKEGIRGAISMVSGTEKTGEGDVKVDVDGQQFEVLPFKNAAFSGSGSPEAALLAAMRKGTTLSIAWTDKSGSTATDHYSLKGFTAAHNSIEDCR
jgi:hypothetical protein